MRELIGAGLALFLGVIGIFFAYSAYSNGNSNSQLQETYIELQQARTELASYANQNGGYGTTAYTAAQIVGLQLLPNTALASGSPLDQWKGAIALTGNTTNFFADYANIDAASCAKLIAKTPASAGITGIAVATTVAGLAAATVYTLPISNTAAITDCGGTTNAVRFVVSG